MGTVRRSRNPTEVLTANGKVHTHEEAQVFVDDLNQFVTVQLLEETPAVLSLGKLCRRRTGEAQPRAEKFGDMITANHKVLNEGCESRDNHLYAVVVQDLATQWIQSYPCKTKSSHDTGKSSSKFLEPSHEPKVENTDNSMEFGKACEDLSWNHRTSTPHRSETNGTAGRAVRRVKEGTSAVLLQ